MIRALLFDLDNTLYSESTGLELLVVHRMNRFVADMFGVSMEEAARMRRELARPYGTTLEWLMKAQGLSDPERYFRFIHPEGEEDCLDEDRELARMLESIPLPKAILTNAPIEHAERILAKLGVAHCFEAVFDIKSNGLTGKPHRESYERALKACGFQIDTTLFIDDYPRYVQGYVDLGGPAVLKDEMDRFVSLPYRRIKTIHELPDLLATLR